jgi:hypothetical protein
MVSLANAHSDCSLFEFHRLGVLGGMGNMHHPEISLLAPGGLSDLFLGDGCIFSVFLSFLFLSHSMAYGMFFLFMGRRLVLLWRFCFWVFGGMREEGRRESSVGMSRQNHKSGNHQV